MIDDYDVKVFCDLISARTRGDWLTVNRLHSILYRLGYDVDSFTDVVPP